MNHQRYERELATFRQTVVIIQTLPRSVRAGSGGDHSAPPGTGVHVRQRTDPSSDERGERPPSASLGPQQQTFGPLDVSAAPAGPSNLERLRDIMRDVLKPVTTPVDEEREKQKRERSG